MTFPENLENNDLFAKVSYIECPAIIFGLYSNRSRASLTI